MTRIVFPTNKIKERRGLTTLVQELNEGCHCQKLNVRWIIKCRSYNNEEAAPMKISATVNTILIAERTAFSVSQHTLSGKNVRCDPVQLKKYWAYVIAGR